MVSQTVLDSMLQQFLQEDIPTGDWSTIYSVNPKVTDHYSLNFREKGVVCGLPFITRLFHLIDQQVKVKALVNEGETLLSGFSAASIEGPVVSILQGERIALNLMQRLSGIATLTAQFVQKATEANPKVRVTDTRKTTPGLRVLEKYAVRVGGGFNHRMNLSDGVMLKDNHLQALLRQHADLTTGIRQVKNSISHVYKLEVEVDRLDQIEPVIQGGAELILLDNMPPEKITEALQIINGRVEVEASGGINLNTIAAVAATGVSVISVGTLTNSASSLDIGLDATAAN